MEGAAAQIKTGLEAVLSSTQQDGCEIQIPTAGIQLSFNSGSTPLI